jgi:hypothetical protein
MKIPSSLSDRIISARPSTRETSRERNGRKRESQHAMLRSGLPTDSVAHTPFIGSHSMKAFKCRPESAGWCVRELAFRSIYSLTGESSPPHTKKRRLMQARVGKAAQAGCSRRCTVTLLICGLSRGNDRRCNLIAYEEMRAKYPSSDHGARSVENL